MPSQSEQPSLEPSEVSKFFDGKTVFMTGAAGYLGVILLESLVRCCPNIRCIYILIRAKKGVQPQERKESIFKKEIFWKIREKNPEVLKKVKVVSGDIAHDNLGMSDDDFEKVTKEVSVVFHCAAAISFFKPLKFMMLQNVVATNSILEFCRKLEKLDVLVYTSTAYSNSNRKEVDEKVYELPFTAEVAMETYMKGSDEDLMKLFNKCSPKFPNFYTFSKCVAENLIVERAADLPIAIVRPSVIINCWKGPLPGYVEDGSGLVSLSLGIGKGLIRVLRMDGEKTVDTIPVDVVANTHIVAAWCQTNQRSSFPSVYNCISSEAKLCTWNEFVSTLYRMALKHPLPKAYQKPALIVCKNIVRYWFLALLDHYTPALVIDFLLWLSGRKPRLIALYRFYDKARGSLEYFMFNDWQFRCENFKSLSDKLNSTDAEIFPVDLQGYDINVVSESIPNGAPIYRWDIDNKSYEQRLRTTYMRYILTSFIKWSFLGCVASAFYAMLF